MDWVIINDASKGTEHLGDPYRGVKAVRMGYKSQMEKQSYDDVLTI